MAYIVFFVLGASLALALWGLFAPFGAKRRRSAAGINLLVFLCLAWLLAVRGRDIGFAPLTDIHGSLLFYALALIGIAFAYLVQKRLGFFPALYLSLQAAAFGLFCLASSPLVPQEALPPLPVLRSAWLVLHVSLAFIGEAFFFFSAVAALLSLLCKDKARATALDRLSYLSILAGYPLFSLGAIVFGAVWAQYAWGRYWGWDPKETWALITWLVYTIYLHIRLVLKKGGRAAPLLALAGFLCTVFTLVGVNYLLEGLHSYR